jgi:dihydrofolate reductase
VRISLIVAASANDVIGAGGALPWHLPDDFRWFRAQTMGKPVAMGRKTWESIGRPLPGRQNIVITRDRGYVATGVEVVHTPEAAVKSAGEAPELMVIGGAGIFRAFRPWASRLYLTRVDAVVEGDTRFPAPDPARWKLLTAESHAADERHVYPFEFQVYERR